MSFCHHVPMSSASLVGQSSFPLPRQAAHSLVLPASTLSGESCSSRANTKLSALAEPGPAPPELQVQGSGSPHPKRGHLPPEDLLPAADEEGAAMSLGACAGSQPASPGSAAECPWLGFGFQLFRGLRGKQRREERWLGREPGSRNPGAWARVV